jgi:plastocyanin
MNILKTKFIAALLSCSLCGAIAIGEDKYVVEQKDKQFVYKGEKVATLQIKVGDVVEFKNVDPYFHNVFSLSDINMFDLGSYAQGKSKSVKFEKRGKIEIECAIHPQMHMTIEVK